MRARRIVIHNESLSIEWIMILRGRATVPTLTASLIALSVLLPSRAARAEDVYEFVDRCRKEQLADCFYRIAERLKQLNAGSKYRVCLPSSFGGGIFDSGVLPVSLLEHVRVNLAAAQFGRAEANVDEVMAGIVNGIYPCGK